LEGLREVLGRNRRFLARHTGRRRIGKTTQVEHALQAAPGCPVFYVQIPASAPAGVLSAVHDAMDSFGLGSNLLELRLYGAKARGEARDDAAFEVAVIVTTDRGKVEEQVVRAAFDVGTAHDVHLSLRILTPERLTDPMWRMTGFVREIERDGISL
jgi:hypothetical protein